MLTVTITTMLLTMSGTIGNWLMEAAIHVIGEMIQDQFVSFKANGNLLTIFEDIFNGENMNLGVNVAQVIMAISFMLIILFTLFAVLKAMAAGLEGEASESPIRVLIRGVITVVMEFLVFGNPFSTSNSETFFILKNGGLISWFGSTANSLIRLIAPTTIEKTFEGGLGITFGTPWDNVVYLILSISVFTGVIGAVIVYLERFLTCGLYILLGPLAIATNTTKATSQTYRDWLMGLIGQFLAIFVSVLGFRMFLQMMSSIITSIDIIDAKTVTSLALAIGMLTLISNSEKIINALGFKTIANGDTARAIAGATRIATGAMLMGITKGIRGGYKLSAKHDARVATAKYGSNNWYSKAMNNLDRKLNGTNVVNSPNNPVGSNVIADGNGGMTTINKTIPGQAMSHIKKRADGNYISDKRYNDAQTKFNESIIDKETGNIAYGNHISSETISTSFGLDNTQNMKITDGYVAQSPSGNPCVIAGVQTTDFDGSISQKTMMFEAGNTNYTGGENIVTSEMGGAAYSIKNNGECIPVGNNTAQITEITKNDVISERQYESLSPDITDNFTDYKSYNSHTQETQNNIESYIEDSGYRSTIEASGREGRNYYAEDITVGNDTTTRNEIIEKHNKQRIEEIKKYNSSNESEATAQQKDM